VAVERSVQDAIASIVLPKFQPAFIPSSLKYWRADLVPPEFTEDELATEEELTTALLLLLLLLLIPTEDELISAPLLLLLLLLLLLAPTEDELSPKSSEEELVCELLPPSFSLEDEEQLADIRNSKRDDRRVNLFILLPHYDFLNLFSVFLNIDSWI
jgi:hypothetical protein